jgi:hypothetical protein
MDVTVTTALIGSGSALLGIALGAIIQWRLAKQSHAFQFALEQARHQWDQEVRKQDEQKRILFNVHTAVNQVARDYSMTALEIVLRSEMTQKEFDQFYRESCSILDQARSLCDLHLPDVSMHMERLHGQMSNFWGNLREALRLGNEPDFADSRIRILEKVIDAAHDISSCADKAKNALDTHL